VRPLPKLFIIFDIRFLIRDDECELQLGDERVGCFKIDLTNADGFDPVFARTVALIKGALGRKPWEGTEKHPIGFALPEQLSRQS
jgi:hypothetical protein